MLKPNPFEKIWNKYDERLEADNARNKDNLYFKSTYEPKFRIQGIFNGTRLNINLSDLYTFLIHEVGRWCESYASDLFINYESLQRIIENQNPDMPTAYRFIGIRDSGVDDVAYVISRMTQDEPIKLCNYYRKLYAIRIQHIWSSHKESGYVYVELRDFTHDICQIASEIQKTNFTVNDYYQLTEPERMIEALNNLYDMKNIIQNLKNKRQCCIESHNKIQTPTINMPIHSMYQHIHELEEQLAAATSNITKLLNQENTTS